MTKRTEEGLTNPLPLKLRRRTKVLLFFFISRLFHSPNNWCWQCRACCDSIPTGASGKAQVLTGKHRTKRGRQEKSCRLYFSARAVAVVFKHRLHTYRREVPSVLQSTPRGIETRNYSIPWYLRSHRIHSHQDRCRHTYNRSRSSRCPRSFPC